MKNKKITVTRTLIEKPENERSLEENAAVKAFRDVRESENKIIEEKNERIRKECPILLSSYENVPIPAYGWIYPVEKLCYAIENINHDCKKYGIKVVLDQSKEKFGGLRFYTSVIAEPIGFFGWFERHIDRIVEWLYTEVDYGMKQVVDKPAYKSLEWRELSKKQFDAKTDEFDVPFGRYGGKVSVVKAKTDITDLTKLETEVFLVEEDGRYYRSYLLHHMDKSHVEYTKNRPLRAVAKVLQSISRFIGKLHRESIVQTIKVHAVDDLVDELVSKAEDECYKRCMNCGIQFGDYYKKCETSGWISYICERCACAHGGKYHKDGKTYVEGVEVENNSKEDEDGGATEH